MTFESRVRETEYLSNEGEMSEDVSYWKDSPAAAPTIDCTVSRTFQIRIVPRHLFSTDHLGIWDLGAEPR